MADIRIIDTQHPYYLMNMVDWDKWRLTYGGGRDFRDRYLHKFDTREDQNDFNVRKDLTPIPTYAKAAVNDIRNAIFQRLVDVIRHGGSNDYMQSVQGERGGVDRTGSTMNYFLGNEPLTDLLVMGKVGVFVDMPSIVSPFTTLADVQGKKPYLYYYRVEDICNWACANPDVPTEFTSVLLRDTVLQYDPVYRMPTCTQCRYRHLWISPETGLVNVQFYDHEGIPVDHDGMLGGARELELTKIPFVLMSIGDSLLKDVSDHQIALMNLCSSDVNYALRSNFPFYTEQRDMRAVGAHLKRVATDGTATTGGQGASDETMKVGVTQGRYYDKDVERPQFIAPPSEPLTASLKLQEKLEQDVRKLVNLAVINLGTRASAESKKQDNESLEAGLSYIGLVLEAAERKIADYWATYEERIESRRQIATIKYPDTYKLKDDGDRIDRAEKLSKLMFAVPGRTVKREMAKGITTVLLSGKVKVDTLRQIHSEIDQADYTTSDPQVIIDAKEAGLVGEKTASVALGFSDTEHLAAREDHVERIKRIAEAQASASPNAARGVDDLDGDPSRTPTEEKTVSQNTDTEDTTNPRTRGES